jgi:hypothetical protein
VLETNHDLDLLWGGDYPKWLKERIAGPFGHLDNAASGRLLAALDRSRLKHVIAAHIPAEQLKADCVPRSPWLRRGLGGVATQEDFWLARAEPGHSPRVALATPGTKPTRSMKRAHRQRPVSSCRPRRRGSCAIGRRR